MKASDRYLVEGVTCSFDGHVCPVANLSVGGIFVVTDDLPMRGQVLSLELTLGQRPAFTVLGQVTWVNAQGGPKAPGLPEGFGAKITRIAFPDKLAILDVLKRTRGAHRVVRGDDAEGDAV